MDLLPYYIAIGAHLIFMIIGFGAVIVIDTFGLLWLFKRVPLSLVNKVANVTQRLIWTGWIGLVLSGLVLIVRKGYVSDLTKIKLFFVLMIGLNGVFLHFIKKSFENIQDGQPLSAQQKFKIGLASFISQLGWWGALAIGFSNRHWGRSITWPETPWPYIFGIAIGLSLIYLIGTALTKKQN